MGNMGNAGTKRETEKPDHLVEINVDPLTGKLTYGGAGKEFHAKPKETIQWRYEGGEFVVFFHTRPGSPFGAQKELRGSRGSPAEGVVSSVGDFHYSVVVCDKGRIYIDDPRVIIP